MKLDIYLNYPGNCQEAFRFYERHLGIRLARRRRPDLHEDGEDLLREPLRHAARSIRHVVDVASGSPGHAIQVSPVRAHGLQR